MTPDLKMPHALLVADARAVKVLAQTDDFDLPEAERIAVLFGQRPAGVACPLAHFVTPFGKKHHAVVTVADRPGSGDPLAFRFLLVSRELYSHLGDPFAVADRYPPDWSASGRLSALEWPMEVLPERTVEQLDGILKAGDVSLLLGGAQALVDGTRVVLQRPSPDELYFRDLWQLLPDRTRAHLRVASFAFSDELRFDAVAMPVLPEKSATAFHTEDGLRDYPQSSYELSLQSAIESKNAGELRRLLARRTADDTIKLGLTIVALALAVAVVVRFLL
jgi:hypothetical protein